MLTWLLLGARNLDSAIALCDSRPPFTPGGDVTLTQYVAQKLDHDYSWADRL